MSRIEDNVLGGTRVLTPHGVGPSRVAGGSWRTCGPGLAVRTRRACNALVTLLTLWSRGSWESRRAARTWKSLGPSRAGRSGRSWRSRGTRRTRIALWPGWSWRPRLSDTAAANHFDLHGVTREAAFLTVHAEVRIDRNERQTEVAAWLVEPAFHGIRDVNGNEVIVVCIHNHYFGDQRPHVRRRVGRNSPFRPVSLHQMERELTVRVDIIHPHPKRGFLDVSTGHACGKRGEVKFDKALGLTHFVTVATMSTT